VNGLLGVVAEDPQSLIFDQIPVVLDVSPGCPPYNILSYLPCMPSELELVNAD